MGYIRHHAIVVTSWTDAIESAHQKAADLGCTVTPIIDSPANHYRTFLVCPDGGKEWRATSDEGNEQRAALLAWLKEGHLSWCEIQYGDDDGVNLMVQHDAGVGA